MSDNPGEPSPHVNYYAATAALLRLAIMYYKSVAKILERLADALKPYHDTELTVDDIAGIARSMIEGCECARELIDPDEIAKLIEVYLTVNGVVRISGGDAAEIMRRLSSELTEVAKLLSEIDLSASPNQ